MSSIYYDPRMYALENYLATGYMRINGNLRGGRMTKESKDLMGLFYDYGYHEINLQAYRAVGSKEVGTSTQKGFLSVSEGKTTSIMNKDGKSIFDVELNDVCVLYIEDIFPERFHEQEILVAPKLQCHWDINNKKVSYVG